ncbi:MAG: UDP-N-acetylglucosamine 1-carboxyvinyltransferase, partial [Desulfofundulus sp.]
MVRFSITGGNPLRGTVRASGSKNATLPILAACLLHGAPNVILQVPALKDVATMCDVLEHLG